MLFNSWTFVGFAIVVLALYYALRGRLRAQNAMLLVWVGAVIIVFGVLFVIGSAQPQPVLITREQTQ